MRSAGAKVSPPDRPTVFIDRNSGGRSFKQFLSNENIPVVLHDEEFSRNTSDEEWIRRVGDRGWLAVSGDNAITRDPLALHYLSHSRLHLFILLELNGISAEAKAKCIAKAYAKMVELAQSSTPPGIWRIGKEGLARQFDFRKTLEKMRRR